MTPAQEEEVKQLAEAIAAAASEAFGPLARTLVANADAPFGKPEFTIRDILLRVGVQAYQQHLTQKKTATQAPA